jgi:glucodextranase-like protein/FecR-like protein
MKQAEYTLKKRVAIFMTFALLTFGAGYVLFEVVIVEQPQPEPVLPKIPKPAIVPVKPPENVKQPKNVLVVSTEGLVERMSLEKEWQLVSVGDRLNMDDSIKTANKASARLRIDEKSEIDLSERSELKVREISDTVHRFKLLRGKIGVDYDAASARVLKIEDAKSEAVAESMAGKFTVLNSDGVISVATTVGEVELKAKKKSVVIKAGEMSRVVPGKKPEPTKLIPVSVMLRVAKPKKQVQRDRFTVVRGRTDVGARVSVNDISASVDHKGRFMARVKLRAGRNRLIVRTSDVAGNIKKRDLGIVIVDANAPIKDINIQWKEKKKAG